MQYTHNMCIINVYRVYKLRTLWAENVHRREPGMKRRVNITLEDKVIERIDHYADEHYTSRSGAITMLIVEATDGSEKKKQENVG